MKTTFTFLVFLALRTISFSQGKLVINEYMPWTPNSCGATADFVELMNFGPGPMNIGCYILTDGDYAITIPPNTILQPGQYYLISGQDVLTYPCANIDSTVHVALNWNTCNCTSGSIPTTGDGFLTDGGSANEQVVLLDPNLNVIDAVARSLPVESSSLIATSTVGGQCTSKSFDLDLMTINYETIGESAGRGNSFARRLDGDCGWLKDPQQSGNATNNTPGDVSNVTYSFNYTKTQACPADGSIAVTVSASNYADVFPMTYTLAYDSDSDQVFETTDTYTYGTVNNPNTIAIGNLVKGMYRLTVASVNGCYLHTFPFSIIDCFAVLPLKLLSFNVYQNTNGIDCIWSIQNISELSHVIIERSMDGINFSSFSTIQAPVNNNSSWNFRYSIPENHNAMPYFRLRIYSQNGQEMLSPIVKTSSNELTVKRSWPNPVRDQLFVESSFGLPGIAEYKVFNMNSSLVLKGTLPVVAGSNFFTIQVHNLPPDVYQLILQDKNHPGDIVRLRFVKL